MQLQHVRKSDLNLLPALLALLEERSISRAAERYHLSQPAMSRVLQRLRQTFHDELLIRSAGGYELTARARALLDELRGVLPDLERLLRGARFDPATAEAQFSIRCPDLAALRMAPGMAAYLARVAPGVALSFEPWTADAFHDLERGKADLAIWGNETPSQFNRQVFAKDEIVCVVRADGPLARKGKLTRRDYADAKHVRVAAFANEETVFERRIEAHGIRRQIGLSVPYFGAAVLAVGTTDLVATVPRGAVTLYQGIAKVAVLPPPYPVEPLEIVMVWHPRLDADPAHAWLRQTIATITAAAEAGMAGASG
jgi:DNA-binding transcriptional LysR family regulator